MTHFRDLRQAAKRGEYFDVESGLPESMIRIKEAVTWYGFVLAYVDMKWPDAAATSRKCMCEALATATPALVVDLRTDRIGSSCMKRSGNVRSLRPIGSASGPRRSPGLWSGWRRHRFRSRNWPRSSTYASAWTH